MREGQPGELLADDAESVGEVRGVVGRGDRLALEESLDGLGGLCVLALAGLENDLPLGELQPDRGVPLRHQRDAASRLDESRGGDDGVRRRRLREEAADGRVVAVDEERGRATTAGLETDDVGTRAGGQRDVDRAGAREGLGHLRERAGADESCRLKARSSGVPAHLTDSEPVPVGGEERDGLAVDLDTDAGEERQGLVPAGGDRHLGHRLGERVRIDRAGDRGHRGEGRVVLERHRQQRETARSTGQHGSRALDGDLDRLGGQGS